MCNPKINALSILSKAMPFPHYRDNARLAVPANWQAPVGVQISSKSTEAHAPAVSALFNWLEEEGEVWTNAVKTGRRM
jgi:D-galactose 1-dehydrogenase